MKRTATAADVVATLALVGVMMAIAAGRSISRRLATHPSQQQCTALLQHYAELVARAADPQVSPSALVERKRSVDVLANQRTFERCESELTGQEVSCGLRASSADEVERCLP